MKISEVYSRTSTLIEELVSVWEKSVRATHHFLSDTEINQIKKYVPMALANVEHLIMIKDESCRVIGFMGVENK